MRGSIMLTAALWLALAITTLGVIDVSHVWWQLRTLQGVADMAALAGAQRLDDTCGTTGTGAQTIVRQNAVANGYSGALTVTCGRYNLSTQTLGAGTPFNAVNVALNTNVDYWFLSLLNAGQAQTVNVAAQATSRVVNVGAFTLTTGLATVQSGQSTLLNGLLSGLLGGTVNLSVLQYNTLASAQVKLSDLAIALGASDVTSLLTQNPTLTQLIAALGTAAAKSNAAASPVMTTVASSVSSTLAGKAIGMNGAGSSSGLLAITLTNPNGALNASVNALDALLVAAEIANAGSLTPITVNLSTLTALNSLLTGTLSIKIGQPPTLAVGEAGQNSAGVWRTVARSAQVSVLLNVDFYVGAALVHLPLYVSAASGNAVLTQTQCGAGASDSGSYMQVQPQIAGLCLAGNAPALFATGTNATLPACGPTGLVANVLGIQLYGMAFTSLNPATKTIAFTGVGHTITSTNPVMVNSNDLGQDLNTAFTTLTTSLSSSLTLDAGGVSVPLGPVLGPVVALLNPLISTLVAPLLTSLMPPLFNLLGVQVGTSTVTDLSLTCGNVQLVN